MRHIGMALLSVVLGALGGCDVSGLTVAACHDFDEADCKAHPACATGTCSLCGGAPAFKGCYDPVHEQPPVCPAATCIEPCSLLDEASCGQRADCRADDCPSCTAAKAFIRCSRVTDPPPACPALGCPQPLPCATITSSADACDARPDCHAVFVDGQACACATPGCCTHFDRCTEGKAKCAGSVVCKSAQPRCEGPYVVSYTATCYEGCVLKTECP